MIDIKQALMEIGISPKEVEVYLAMLELGPASVQDIAKKAGVNRTTTYVMLEGLQRHGLMSSFEKGKKTMFVAENPQRLVNIISAQVMAVEEKRSHVQSLMPRLLAIFNAIEDKPKVRFFEGEEALSMIRREIVDLRQEIFEVMAVDESMLTIASTRGEERIALNQQGQVRGKILMAIKPGCQPMKIGSPHAEVRVFNYEAFPFSGSLEVVGKRIYILTTKSRGLGIVIESQEVATMMRALLEAIWRHAKPYQPEESSATNKNTATSVSGATA
ncbi:MAG: helix-turn-helix domain-containing protein [Patescibacteria group bacterium]